jgi:hypothetical protein
LSIEKSESFDTCPARNPSEDENELLDDDVVVAIGTVVLVVVTKALVVGEYFQATKYGAAAKSWMIMIALTRKNGVKRMERTRSVKEKKIMTGRCQIPPPSSSKYLWFVKPGVMSFILSPRWGVDVPSSGSS